MAELLKIQVLDGGLLDVLSPIIERLEDPTQLYERLGAVHEANVQLRFETKTDPDGNAWEPLSESTQKSYAKKYDGKIPGSLLERTREMRNSLTHNADSTGVDVGYGGVRYPIYHETGRKDGKMPRRGTLVSNWQTGELGASDRADLVAEIESYLTDRF